MSNLFRSLSLSSKLVAPVSSFVLSDLELIFQSQTTSPSYESVYFVGNVRPIKINKYAAIPGSLYGL